MIKGTLQPDVPAVILYDLCATGQGLKEVASALRKQEQGIRDTVEICACVIHVFAEDEASRKESGVAEESIWDIDAFSPGMLKRTKSDLDGIVAFSREKLPVNKQCDDMTMWPEIPEDFRLRSFKNHQPMPSDAELIAAVS